MSMAVKQRERKIFHSIHLTARIKFTSDFDKKCDVSCEKGSGFEMEPTSAKVCSLFMLSVCAPVTVAACDNMLQIEE